MNPDLLKKLQSETPLTAQEEAMLDAALASESQRQAARLVELMPDETVSLAWRSDLIEKLRDRQVKQRRRESVFWVLRPASAVAVAAAVFGVYLVGKPGQVAIVERPNIEVYMVEAHKQTETVSLVAASGIGALDAPRNGVSNSMTVDWEEVDLGAL